MKRQFIWIFILFSNLVAAQVLNIKKGYSYKTALRLEIGDSIGFRLSGDPNSYGGHIKAIGDSSIFVGQHTVRYSDITEIIVNRNSGFRRFLKGMPGIMYKFSLYYFVYGNLNAWIADLWTPEYLKTHTITSLSMVGSGMLIQITEKSTRYKHYKTQKRYRLVPVIFP